jgi:lipopolysaccharide/colanic/teichoic acid biosynthesis glycosyltransferase
VKRVFDIACSVAGVILLSPLILGIAILIKTTSRGPAVYKGRRVGRFGKVFNLLKFRTMVLDADRIGGPTTSDLDPRITEVGRYLRRCKLDELPQLINVIKGDMSLVGPRPEVETEVACYSPEQRKVFDLRPGITDFASLWNADEGALLANAADPHGAYKKYIQPTKLALQIKYLEERSFWLDVKLIVYTLLKITRKGWAPSELRSFPAPIVPAKETIASKESAMIS